MIFTLLFETALAFINPKTPELAGTAPHKESQ